MQFEKHIVEHHVDPALVIGENASPNGFKIRFAKPEYSKGRVDSAGDSFPEGYELSDM